MDPHLKHIAATFKQAIDMIDETEPQVRDLVEKRLMNPAGRKVTAALTKEIAAVRSKAIKRAFRHLRDNLPSHNGL